MSCLILSLTATMSQFWLNLACLGKVTTSWFQIILKEKRNRFLSSFQSFWNRFIRVSFCFVLSVLSTFFFIVFLEIFAIIWNLTCACRFVRVANLRGYRLLTFEGWNDHSPNNANQSRCTHSHAHIRRHNTLAQSPALSLRAPMPAVACSHPTCSDAGDQRGHF